MSLTSLMNLGSRAMYAAQAQLQTTSHNIANASVAGYSRQSVVLTTAMGQSSDAGYFGRGVDVQTVNRAVDGFMTNEAANTNATASSDAARKAMLDRLEQSFTTGVAGLGNAATKLFQSFSDVAAKSDDLSARQVAISQAANLASLFRSTADQVTSVQSSIKESVKNDVASVNDYATQIADLNTRIAGYRGNANAPNDLLDKRDQLINSLSKYVQVSRVQQDDGQVNLFVGGSQTLVLGGGTFKLQAGDDPTDASKTKVSIVVDGQPRTLDETLLVGGSIHGNLQAQNSDVSATLTALNNMAEGIAAEMNKRQGFGLDLNGAQGKDLFTFTPGLAAQSLQVTGLTPQTIAAANPVVATSGAAVSVQAALPGEINVTNVGSGKVNSVTISATPTQDPTYATPLTVVFTDDAGAYKIVDNTNPTGAPVSSGTWAAGSKISYNGIDLTLSGFPKSKDSFSISPTTVPASNNGNALAFAAMTTQGIVGGQTFINAFASTLADLGSRVQNAGNAADVSAASADQAKQNLSAATGVNLDDEAANLMQAQQAMQAAGKVVQTAQKIFETILSLGG